MRTPKYRSPSGRPMRQCRYLKVPHWRYIEDTEGELTFAGYPYKQIKGFRRCQGWAMPDSRYCHAHQKKGKG